MNESIILTKDTKSLKEKVEFLSLPSTYKDATKVEVLETHMSWVFLTNKFVFKLKKPVCYSFLDFSTMSARLKYCMEEVRVNHPLGGDTYLGVVPLTSLRGQLQLDMSGEVIDWLVKMRRLVKEQMLHAAIENGTLREEWVQLAAEKLTDFYLASTPLKVDTEQFRRQIARDIELYSVALSDIRFKLSNQMIVDISTDLLDFIIKHTEVFDQRVSDGRIVDAHGDLRPEHICLGSHPVIIDRIEFNSNLRVMDIAEDLSFLAMECDMIAAPATGRLFLDVYRRKSKDNIPDMLIYFYKAKRAFLRAKLSIDHLYEEKYMADEKKWRGRCEAYLKASGAWCRHLREKFRI